MAAQEARGEDGVSNRYWKCDGCGELQPEKKKAHRVKVLEIDLFEKPPNSISISWPPIPTFEGMPEHVSDYCDICLVKVYKALPKPTATRT
jgi:hypothetical protein